MNTKEPTNNRQIVLFFLITYCFSWFFWIPQALMVNGYSIPGWFAQFLTSQWNLAAFGPLIAGLILTLYSQGWRGLLALLKKGIDFSFRKRWLIPVLLLPPSIYGVSLWIASAIGWIKPDAANLATSGFLPLVFVIILFTAGPFQEEFAWRGFALPHLQKHFTPLVSSLILGILWGLWHLPAAFSNSLIVDPQFYWALVVQITLSNIVFTWVFNHTNQSILAVLLLHTMINFSIWLAVPSMKLPTGYLAISILLYLFIDLIIIFSENRMASKKPTVKEPPVASSMNFVIKM